METPSAIEWLERRKASLKGAPFVCMKCDKEHNYPAEKCESCNRKTVRSLNKYIRFLTNVAKDKVFLEHPNPEEAWVELCDKYEIDLNKIKYDESVDRLKSAAGMRDGSTGHIIIELAKQSQLMETFASFRDNGELFYYRDGIFIPNGESVVEELCTKLMKSAQISDRLSAHLLNEVKLKVKIDSYNDREDFDSKPELVCMLNGVYNLSNKEFVEHSPTHKMFVRIPVVYDKEAFPTKFHEFLGQVVAKENINLMYEIIGYCLYRRYSHHKAFMFIGEGANGKSTFIDSVRRFLGDENCVNIPLQELEESRFAKGNLYRRLANLCPDLSSKGMKGSGTFKMATGGDALTVDKKFKDMFTFVNYAKLIFSANRIPTSPDDTDAFFRRWVIVNFPNRFEGEKADKLLIDKLTTPEEISGIFNVAVCGLKHLLNNGAFTAEQSMDEAREIYTRLSDSVAAFIMDDVEIAGNEYVVKKSMLQAYTEYCRKMKYPAVGDTTFYKRMNAQIRYEETQKKIDGKYTRVWIGIRLKKEEIEKIDTQNTL